MRITWGSGSAYVFTDLLLQLTLFEFITLFELRSLLNGKMARKVNKANTSELQDEIPSLSYFDLPFAELQKSLASNEDISLLREVIEKQRESIQKLECRVDELERKVHALSAHGEAQEQYIRRDCLRIDGIPTPINGAVETEDEIRVKVQELAKACGVDIPKEVIDRAHRIGKERTVMGQHNRQVIVKFRSFSHRTRLYKARKQVKSHRIYLDLTKSRTTLLQQVNKEINDRRLEDSFAFADINCQLCMKLGKTFRLFLTLNEAVDILDDVRRIK